MDDKQIAALSAFAIIQAIVIYPICRIYRRAGFKWYWGLVTLVPLAGFLAMLGALASAEWPSTSARPRGATGAHSLYWLAGFSALFLFGIPGADSEEWQSALNLSAFIYFTACVAQIYRSAGFSGWGGVMGLLGITNLIWPWLIAFRQWPSAIVHENINTAEIAKDTLRDRESAKKFGIQPDEINSYEAEQSNSVPFVETPTTEEVVVPPPIPVSNKNKFIQTQPAVPVKTTLTRESSKSTEAVKNSYFHYEIIAAELMGKRPKAEGVYLKAQMESGGDEGKTKLLYTKYRLEQLLAKE